MPKDHSTTFMSSADNKACATEFAEALKAQGILSTVGEAAGSVSVSYRCTDAEFQPLIPLMIAIEKQHTEPPAPAPAPKWPASK